VGRGAGAYKQNHRLTLTFTGSHATARAGTLQAKAGGNPLKRQLMTEKQQERIKGKIRRIKSALAADKKRWGGFYDDSRGLRYLPPALYLQLGDFSGGLRYLNWFNKHFPDDSGFPDFLFEWAIILFKTGRQKEAERKAFRAFCRNTYLFDKFFGRPIVPVPKWEGSNLESPGFAVHHFDYSSKQADLADFSAWLDRLTQSAEFRRLSEKYIAIQRRLKNESDTETRRYLCRLAAQLEDEMQ